MMIRTILNSFKKKQQNYLFQCEERAEGDIYLPCGYEH